MRTEWWTAPTGQRRLLTRLDARESAAYARAARTAFPAGLPGPRAYGSATGPGRAVPPFTAERAAWRRRLMELASSGPALAAGDVADFYPSVRERALEAAARAAGGDAAALIHQLRTFWELGVPGLPVGPATSSFVADAVLAIADRAVGLDGVGIVRWVDDIVLAGSRAGVARAAASWARALADLGLAENVTKRRPLDLEVLRLCAGTTSCDASARGRVIIRRS